MGAQQSCSAKQKPSAEPSRKLTFPEGSVETQEFFSQNKTTIDGFTMELGGKCRILELRGKYRFCDTIMIEPNSTLWWLNKKYNTWCETNPSHIHTAGWRVSDLYVENGTKLYVVTDKFMRPDGTSNLKRVYTSTKLRDGDIVRDSDGSIFQPPSEPLANPLKHPFLDILNEFLVKKAETVKVEV